MSDTDILPLSRSRPETIARVLGAASEIFLREGFAGASVDEVAAAAQMSKLSIYEIFPTKAALFEAAVRRSSDRHFFNPPSSTDETGIDECLTILGSMMFERFVDPINFGLFRANIEAANHFPELAADLHMHRRQASRASAAFLQRWVDRGDLKVRDAMAAVITFSALCIEGTRYFLGRQPPSPEERADIVHRIVTLFLDGYAAATSAAVPGWPKVGPPHPPIDVATRMAPARRERMLSAVKEEFLAHGYKGASIDRAVSPIKVGKTTVYRQFGSKTGIFRYILERHVYEDAGKAYEIPGAATSLHAAVADLARQAIDDHCEWGNIRMHRLLIQEADRVPDLARRFYDVRSGRLGLALAQVLAGHGLPAPDPAISRDFYNLATSALRFLTVSTLPDAAQREGEAQEVARIFLDGVRAAAG